VGSASDPLRGKITLTRRDEAAARLCGDILAQLGFRIVGATATGVYVEGDPGLFELTFRARVVFDENGPHFEPAPSFEALAGAGVESAYFPTQPSFHR